MDNQILDELMALAEFDPEEIKYIREHISPELSAKLDDDTLQYIVDLLLDYMEKHEDDGSDEIILDDVAQYIVAQAQKENMGQFDSEELVEILDADFDYMDSLEG